jgi:hypothetical protein
MQDDPSVDFKLEGGEGVPKLGRSRQCRLPLEEGTVGITSREFPIKHEIWNVLSVGLHV